MQFTEQEIAAARRLRKVGLVDRFKEIMTWLPTWFDCRKILASLDVSPTDVVGQLGERSGIENGDERFCLYQMIEEELA